MKKLLLSIVFCLFPACVLLSAETEQDEPGMAEERIDSCDILWNDSLSLSLAELYKNPATQQGDSSLLASILLEADQRIRQAYNQRDTVGLVDAYLRKGDAEYHRNMYNSAYTLYDSAINLVQSKIRWENYWSLLSSLYLRQGETSYFIGKYVSGVEYLYRLLDSESSLDPAVRMQAYILLGKLFVRLQKNDLAIEYLGKAESIQQELQAQDSLPATSFPLWHYTPAPFPEKGQPKTKQAVSAWAGQLSFELNISYSSAYIQKGEIPSSLNYIERARKTASIKDLAKVYQNLSIHYLYVSELDKAAAYCLQALELSGNIYEKSVLANNYAVILLEQGRYDSALAVCNRNLAYTSQTDVYHVRSNLYFIYSRIYEAQGRYKEALSYRRMEQEVLDSVYNQESEEKILQLNRAFATDKLIRDKQLLETQFKLQEVENSRKNILILLFTLLLLLAIVLIVIIVKHLSRQRKMNRHLEEEIVHVTEDSRKVLQSSQAEFDQTLAEKRRELTANTMYIAKMCDTANQILSEVHKLEPFCVKKESKVLLLNIQRQVASLTMEERGWNDFKLYFEQIHPSFFTRLNKAYPNLTAGENRLCAFLVMNLTTKEISALTNRAVRSVETAKFRLRKKMEIPKETSLSSFLWQFTGETGPAVEKI